MTVDDFKEFAKKSVRNGRLIRFWPRENHILQQSKNCLTFVEKAKILTSTNLHKSLP